MNRTIKEAGWVLILCLLSGGFLFSFGQKDDAKETLVQNNTEKVPVQDDMPEMPIQNNAPVFDSGYYETAVEGQEVVITGTIRLVGSDPFPQYVLTEAGKYDWYIPDSEDRKVISGFEQQIITVKGTVVLRELILANGRRLGTEHILQSVSLVK